MPKRDNSDISLINHNIKYLDIAHNEQIPIFLQSQYQHKDEILFSKTTKNDDKEYSIKLSN